MNEEGKKFEKESKANKYLKMAVIILGVIIFACVFFALGKFSGNRFERKMGGNFGGFENRGQMTKGGFGNGKMSIIGRGITGDITNISGNTVTISANNKNYTVTILDATSIIKNNDIAKKSDLSNGNSITVIGPSNSNGEIQAKIIRVN